MAKDNIYIPIYDKEHISVHFIEYEFIWYNMRVYFHMHIAISTEGGCLRLC